MPLFLIKKAGPLSSPSIVPRQPAKTVRSYFWGRDSSCGLQGVVQRIPPSPSLPLCPPRPLPHSLFSDFFGNDDRGGAALGKPRLSDLGRPALSSLTTWPGCSFLPHTRIGLKSRELKNSPFPAAAAIAGNSSSFLFHLFDPYAFYSGYLRNSKNFRETIVVMVAPPSFPSLLVARTSPASTTSPEQLVRLGAL
jgi:hypothetical protein